MPLKSPLGTVVMFGLTCFSVGICLVNSVLAQEASLRLGGLLAIAIVTFSAVVQARRILRAVEASKADQRPGRPS